MSTEIDIRRALMAVAHVHDVVISTPALGRIVVTLCLTKHAPNTESLRSYVRAAATAELRRWAPAGVDVQLELASYDGFQAAIRTGQRPGTPKLAPMKPGRFPRKVLA